MGGTRSPGTSLGSLESLEDRVGDCAPCRSCSGRLRATVAGYPRGGDDARSMGNCCVAGMARVDGGASSYVRTFLSPGAVDRVGVSNCVRCNGGCETLNGSLVRRSGPAVSCCGGRLNRVTIGVDLNGLSRRRHDGCRALDGDVGDRLTGLGALSAGVVTRSCSSVRTGCRRCTNVTCCGGGLGSFRTFGGGPRSGLVASVGPSVMNLALGGLRTRVCRGRGRERFSTRRSHFETGRRVGQLRIGRTKSFTETNVARSKGGGRSLPRVISCVRTSSGRSVGVSGNEFLRRNGSVSRGMLRSRVSMTGCIMSGCNGNLAMSTGGRAREETFIRNVLSGGPLTGASAGLRTVLKSLGVGRVRCVL